MKEIDNTHSLEKFHELSEKKETFRKIINLVHQMDFNLSSNNILLSITSATGQGPGIFCQNNSLEFKTDI